MIFSKRNNPKLKDIVEIPEYDQFFLNNEIEETGAQYDEDCFTLILASLNLNKKVILYKGYENIVPSKYKVNQYKISENWIILYPNLKKILKNYAKEPFDLSDFEDFLQKIGS